MNDFERESSTMDMKEEMMSDAVDDAMEDEDEGEGEEAEGDKILKEVLDEIGMGMNDAVSPRGQRPIRAVLEERRLDEQRTELPLLPEWLLLKDYPRCLVNLGVAVAAP
jgi:hypothetical protein